MTKSRTSIRARSIRLRTPSGCQRGLENLDAERAQRVFDGGEQDGSDADVPAFAEALGSERSDRRRCLDVDDVDVGTDAELGS